MSISSKSYEMTGIQKGVWVTELKHQGTSMFNIGGTCSVETELDFTRLTNAIQRVIKETQILNFTLNDEIPPKFILDSRVENNIDFIDFRNRENPQREFEQWREACLSRKMDLGTCLYYFCLYKVSDSKCGFLIKIHHLVCDGVTMQNIIARVCECYNNPLNDVVHCEFSDDQSYFLALEEKYSSSRQYDKDKLFWRNFLAGKGENSNFILGNRTLSTKAIRKIYDIPHQVSKRIKHVCATLGCTENVFYYAVIALLLSRLSGSKQVSFGIPLHGRKKTNLVRNSMTVSTVPTQIAVDEYTDFSSLIKSALENNNQIYRHQKYDYTELVKETRVGASVNDLFDVSYNYANTKYELVLGEYPLIVEDIFPGEQQYSIQFLFKELLNEGTTKIYCDYKVEEYTPPQIDAVINLLIEILDEVSVDPHRQLLMVAPLKEDNLKLIETGANNAAPTAATVISLFEQSVESNKDRLAIIEESGSLTFQELRILVSTISANLLNHGVSGGSRVAILLPKSAEQIATLLAIMAVGATYIPLEKDLPQERIKYILSDSECALVITNPDWASLLPAGVAYCDSAALSETLPQNDLLPLPVRCEPTSEAYLIYTSGSTGLPKGTIIRQPELVNYCRWAAQVYYPEKSDVAAYYTPLTFDLTVTSLFPALISGSAIKVYTETSNFILSDIIHDGVATVVKCTPSHLRAIQHEIIGPHCAIKRFIVGGENLKVSVANHTYLQFGGKADIFNEYGPTETVVGCMIHQFDPAKDSDVSVPIGEPIDNTQIYIVDSYGRHCIPYMKGEMVIAGNGVSAGYWNRSELTQNRFITDRFYPRQRAYLSGDLAYRNEYGQVTYLGRIDKQVKIRGHRIEIEEIETKLLEHKDVQDVAIVIDEANADASILKAFVVLSEGSAVSGEELKQYLSSHLLHYMVPQLIKCIREIPLTFNGKVDSAKLLELEDDKIGTNDDEKMSALEISVLEEFRRVLGCTELSIHSDFYQSGGDSIKAIQLVTLLQKKGISVVAKEVLQLPTPKLLCRHIDSRAIFMEPEEAVKISTFSPTPIMKWFSGLLLGKKEIYHQMLSLSFPSCLTQTELDKILDALVSFHPILNSYVKDKHFTLQVREAMRHVKTRRVNVMGFEQREYVARTHLEASSWPESELFQAIILDDGNETELLLIAHHLIIDGVSWHILITDLNTLVEQHLNHQPLKLRQQNNNYARWIDFTEHYAKTVSEDEINFWQQQISGASLFTYQDLYNRKLTVGLLTSEIAGVNFDSFTKLCGILKLKPNELFFSLFTYSLFKTFNKNNFTVELEGIGRSSQQSEVDLSHNIGWFTSIYPLICHCEDNISSHVKKTKIAMRRVNDNGMAYQSIRHCSTEKHLSRIHNVPKFNYLGDFSGSVHQGAVNIKSIYPHAISSVDNIYTEAFDFNIYWEQGCKVSVSYIEQLIDIPKIENIINVMESKLKELIDLNNYDFKDFYIPSDFPTISLSSTELEQLISKLSMLSI
ncbi:amino acid adenylation domain-containing protein [Photorhabdus akhurstii]|uniref:amino acid adenylation domain-containing protein n=1 Tax=Photorhabdus akhurstii TaxID=171438 RepID=UPI0037039F4B